MIYWFTGQPGHGKTLHALERAMEFRDEGRLVYVCNVRDFDYDKARMMPMSPEQFCDWMNFLPDGAVAVVDEAYEHGMLPKRPPGSKVPPHVQQLAKHRHRGLDFIFVSQSPQKQVDEFVHDLIEQHVHVRRRFGLPFVHLKIFDQFEPRPQKAQPLTRKRVKLPKRPMGLYTSTVMDTTERSIPWFYPAIALLIFAVLFGAYKSITGVKAGLSGEDAAPVVMAGPHPAMAEEEHRAEARGDDEASATPSARELRSKDYVGWLTPRIGGQPWTAPAYDHLSVPATPPRLFCMASGEDGNDGCTCLTDQGTRYAIEHNRCRLIAREGQYEPFLDVNRAAMHRLDDMSQKARIAERQVSGGVGGLPPTVDGGDAAAPLPGATISATKQVSGYGDIGARVIESAPR